jgi:hypothetical protein
MTHAAHEWTQPKPEHASVVGSDAFKDQSFLVEYVSGTSGCSCLAKTETMLGVYLGRALSIMIEGKGNRWIVRRFAIVNR